MKKLFFIAALSFVTVFGISATVVESSTTDSYTSSVTASISGLGEDIDFETATLAKIYNFLPQRVKELCVDSYADISSLIERSGKSFTYAGVKITLSRAMAQLILSSVTMVTQ